MMKKSFFKTLRIVVLLAVLSHTSCKQERMNETISEKESSVELKISTPQPSPLGRIFQKVGLTDVTIEYSRPGVKGRTVFGDLVPFGKIWRTGANANTKITFSSNIIIGDQMLSAGSYGLYTIPNQNSWEILFYSETNHNGVPRNWDETKVVLKTSADVVPMPTKIETFTINFDELTNTSALINFLWENTSVGIKFKVPTDELVTSSIETVMNATPTSSDYYNAAVYYSQENKDIEKANQWMQKAMSMTKKPTFWQLRQQSLIFEKMGNKKKAIETAEKSLDLSIEAGNEAYIKMNRESLMEWGLR